MYCPPGSDRAADPFWTPAGVGGRGQVSADGELRARGARPSFLLFQGPVVAPLLAWLLEGKGHETGVPGRALRDFTWGQK